MPWLGPRAAQAGGDPISRGRCEFRPAEGLFRLDDRPHALALHAIGRAPGGGARRRREGRRVRREQAKEIIAQAASDERDYFDNMRASLQSETGKKVDADATRLEEADRNLAAVLATLKAIGVDPVGDLERLFEAGKLSDVPPVAQG
jgi:hypothetical protein